MRSMRLSWRPLICIASLWTSLVFVAIILSPQSAVVKIVLPRKFEEVIVRVDSVAVGSDRDGLCYPLEPNLTPSVLSRRMEILTPVHFTIVVKQMKVKAEGLDQAVVFFLKRLSGSPFPREELEAPPDVAWA